MVDHFRLFLERFGKVAKQVEESDSLNQEKLPVAPILADELRKLGASESYIKKAVCLRKGIGIQGRYNVRYVLIYYPNDIKSVALPLDEQADIDDHIAGLERIVSIEGKPRIVTPEQAKTTVNIPLLLRGYLGWASNQDIYGDPAVHATTWKYRPMFDNHDTPTLWGYAQKENGLIGALRLPATKDGLHHLEQALEKQSLLLIESH